MTAGLVNGFVKARGREAEAACMTPGQVAHRAQRVSRGRIEGERSTRLHARMPRMESSYEARALLDAMHAYSEERCAGWLTDMEFTLWSAVMRDNKYNCDADPSLVRLLRMLAANAGGWWVHCITMGADWKSSGGRVFLMTEKWEAIYAAKGEPWRRPLAAMLICLALATGVHILAAAL